MIEWSVIQEDKIILNVFAPKNRASKYVRQKLIELQGVIDKSTIIIRDLNIPLSLIDRLSWRKISKISLNRATPSIN